MQRSLSSILLLTLINNSHASGLSNLVNETDLLKIIVEQNECLIQLAANNAISNAGMVGDALVITSTSMYYNNIKQYFKEITWGVIFLFVPLFWRIILKNKKQSYQR